MQQLACLDIGVSVGNSTLPEMEERRYETSVMLTILLQYTRA